LGRLDLAVVGAAGTWLAHAMQRARPDWSITLFERHDRIGGRLRSVKVPRLDHPIELGGMRYVTSNRLVQSVIDELRIPTRPFDTHGVPERTFLRGVFGDGPSDPDAGAGYDLQPHERGRSADDLASEAFRCAVPSADDLDATGWRNVRATHRFGDRPITDWSVGDVLATTLSPDAHRFVVDAFGYDSGMRVQNVGVAIEYFGGGGHPNAQARVPLEGMDTIPRGLAARFRELGGVVELGHGLRAVEVHDGGVRLRLTSGEVVEARRLALATPVTALIELAERSPALASPEHRRLYRTVEIVPATKLYLWWDRPWWRHPTDGPRGIRMTTDLMNRKLWYLDDAGAASLDQPAAMVGSFSDLRHTQPIVALAGGASNGEPAPEPLLSSTLEQLRALHPYAEVTAPAGSAFMHWGADPHDLGWSFWATGCNPDDVIPAAIQPDRAVPILPLRGVLLTWPSVGRRGIRDGGARQGPPPGLSRVWRCRAADVSDSSLTQSSAPPLAR
jgi:monoamine oxidase